MVSPSTLGLFGESSSLNVENNEEFINPEEELRNPGYVFPEIDTSSFINHLLPPLKEGIDIKSIRSALSKKGFTGFGGKWKGLWTVSGGKRRKKHDTFAPLVDIFQRATSVAAAKMPHVERIIGMVLLSAPERREGYPRSTSSQDACFVLKDQEKTTFTRNMRHHAINFWDGIALTASFRRNSNDETRKENARKIVSNMQLAMARDPCRRFAFGITVENTFMRLWFCSRASPVVSKPFDFSKDLDLLIHVFLSLAFATKEELGWDPTIQPFIRDDGRRVYRIDVDGETYETDQVLSKSSAEQLTGHATRVWIVHRPGSDDLHVLKDVWIEDDERPEHSVYEMLLHDVEDVYGTEVRQQVASHLLTPVAHYLVQVNGEEDDTTSVMMRGYIPSFKENYRVSVENLGSRGDEGVSPSTEIGIKGLERGGLKDPLHWYNPLRKILPRKHYRVVFKELAKPLHAVRDLEDVFTVLSDSAKILKWIHGASWVHRDLSVGNLYLYQCRGLIGDLEYAKRKKSDLDNEVQTGTPDFMAVETAKRCYIHLPPVGADQLKTELAALLEGRVEYLQKMMDSRIPPPFFHNDLHDLESLWWIAIWELFNNHIVPLSGIVYFQTEEQDFQRESVAAELFSENNAAESRRLFIQAMDDYYNQVAWMPECLRSVKILLDSLRTELVFSYRKFEASFTSNPTEICDGIQDEFQRLFAKCRDASVGLKVMPYKGLRQRLRGSRRDTVDRATLASCTQPDDRLSNNDIIPRPKAKEKGLHLRPEPVREHSVRKRKRKRDDDDDDSIVSVRPRSLPCKPHSPPLANMPHVLDTSSSRAKQSTPPPSVRGESCYDYVEDSPARLRTSHTRKYQEGDLDSKREAVREEVGPFIPEISLTAFMKYLFPPLKDWIDLPEVLSLLEREADVITNSQEKVFKEFEKAPRNKREHEDIVFAPLAELFEKVCRFATRHNNGVEENFILATLPNFTPFSERGVKQRPDACLIGKQFKEFAKVAVARKVETTAEKAAREARNETLMATEGGAPTWYDIAMAPEWKKDKAIVQRNKNTEQGLFHCQQIMSLDPCRRFVFGITVEDRMMRLWFCSRATPVVSKPFDFTTSIRDLVQVFLSLAFASKEELGWDPTIQAIMTSEKKRLYYIEVKGRMHMTKRILEDVAAEALISSGTRVWEVIDIESGEPCILKDTWVEDDRNVERSIHSMMLDDVEKIYGVEIRNFVASHLITPTMDCIVPVHGVEDHTTSVMMRGYTPPTEEVFELKIDKPTRRETKGSIRAPSLFGSTTGSELDIQMEECSRRKHYRVVYAEIAEPLYQVKKISHSFIALGDAAKCLKYLHGADWVHRDLSAENLYYYQGRGLIGDLEYARCKSSRNAAHRMRTANVKFMSAEALQRKYLYKPVVREQRLDYMTWLQQPDSEASFFHNDLHDVESLWWIAVYEIFRQGEKYGSKVTGKSVQRAATKKPKTRLEAARQLFPDSGFTEERIRFLNDNGRFIENLIWMPANLAGIKPFLSLLRETLVRGYVEFEENFPELQMTAFQGKQDVAKSSFMACANVALQTEPADTSQLPNAEGGQDEKEDCIPQSSKVRSESLTKPGQKASGPLEDYDGDSPESPTPCRTGKRKRVDKEPSPERHLSKPR
ncbi:hypothetical protein ACEPAG_9473 [Sanghuangporus baumii]